MTRLIGTYAGTHVNDVRALGFTSQGQGWSVDANGILRLWDGATGQKALEHRVGTSVATAALSPDGDRLVVGYEWGQVHVWDLKTFEAVDVGTPENGDHILDVVFVSARQFIARTTGRTLVRGSTDRPTLKKLWTHDHETTALDAHVDGAVVFGTERGDVVVMAHAHDPVPEGATFTGEGRVLALALDDDGRRVAVLREGADFVSVHRLGETGSTRIPLGRAAAGAADVAFRDDRIVVVDTEGSVLVARANDARFVELSPASTPAAAAAPHLAVSRDGQRAAVARPKAFRLLNLETGAWLTAASDHPGGAITVALDPRGTGVSGALGGTVSIWDTSSSPSLDRSDGASLRPLTGHDGAVTSVAISQDGHAIASSDARGIVRVQDPSGRELWSQDAHERVGAVAFSPDARSIAIGLAQTGTRVYPCQSPDFSSPTSLTSDTGGILALLWVRPDTTVLATERPFVKIWDPGPGVERETESDFDKQASIVGSYTALAVSGNTILAGTSHGGLVVWRADFAATSHRQLATSGTALKRVHRGPKENDGYVAGVGLLDDASKLVSVSEHDARIALTDTNGQPLDELDLGASGDAPISLAVGWSGRWFVVGTRRGVLLRYDLAAPK